MVPSSLYVWDDTVGGFVPCKSTGNAAHVQRPSEYAGTLTPFETSDPVSGSVTSQTPTAARVVHVAYLDLGSAVGTVLYICFNEADPATALGVAATRQVIKLGENRTFVFPSGGECTKISYKSDVAAETGSSLVAGEYVE